MSSRISSLKSPKACLYCYLHELQSHSGARLAWISPVKKTDVTQPKPNSNFFETYNLEINIWFSVPRHYDYYNNISELMVLIRYGQPSLHGYPLWTKSVILFKPSPSFSKWRLGPPAGFTGLREIHPALWTTITIKFRRSFPDSVGTQAKYPCLLVRVLIYFF